MGAGVRGWAVAAREAGRERTSAHANDDQRLGLLDAILISLRVAQLAERHRRRLLDLLFCAPPRQRGSRGVRAAAGGAARAEKKWGGGVRGGGGGWARGPVRARTKTGLPRHLTIMQLPGSRPEMSTSSEARASTSAAGFIAARNLTTSSRAADAPRKRAPPIIV